MSATKHIVVGFYILLGWHVTFCHAFLLTHLSLVVVHSYYSNTLLLPFLPLYLHSPPFFPSSDFCSYVCSFLLSSLPPLFPIPISFFPSSLPSFPHKKRKRGRRGETQSGKNIVWYEKDTQNTKTNNIATRGFSQNLPLLRGQPGLEVLRKQFALTC